MTAVSISTTDRIRPRATELERGSSTLRIPPVDAWANVRTSRSNNFVRRG
jgi:hypothetical protein